MSLQGKRLVLGITGSIAAYKAVLLVRALQERGATVRVAMTRAAARFVGPVTFTGLTGTPALTELWDPSYAGQIITFTYPHIGNYGVNATDDDVKTAAAASLGRRSILAIARAVVANPSVILADEPTGDLDRDTADQVLELLQRLNSELAKTILMVTHDPHAAETAQRIVRLDKGQLIGIEDTASAGAR